MLITTTRRHLCLIFLKTAGAILLFQVARANWPATRTKLTTNTFQVKISKYKLKITLTRPTMKEEEKTVRAKSFPLPAWVATWSVMPQPQELLTWSCWNINICKGRRNLNVLWDIWDIWWLRTECLTMVARKYSQYWIGVRQNRYKSTHPP